MSAFGGNRSSPPKPPEKGVFPLDHFGECKQVKDDYLACLKRNENQALRCQEVAKLYLECRMTRNLMAQQNLADLGFREGQAGADHHVTPRRSAAERTETGFIAGIKKP